MFLDIYANNSITDRDLGMKFERRVEYTLFYIKSKKLYSRHTYIERNSVFSSYNLRYKNLYVTILIAQQTYYRLVCNLYIL